MTTTRLTPGSTRVPRLSIFSACMLLLHAMAPCQRFQQDYGTPSVPEIGTCVTRVPSGYAIGGVQGINVLGIVTNPNGGKLIDVRPTPIAGNPPMEVHCMRRLAGNKGVIVSGEVQTGSDWEVFLAHYSNTGALWPLGAWGPGKYYLYQGHRTGIRQGTRVIERIGGGFAVITNVDPSTNSRGVLFTTDANGAQLSWTAYSYGGLPVRFHDLCQDADGTYLIVGSIADDPTGRRRTLVLRTNPSALPIWAMAYGNLPSFDDVEQHAITRIASGYATGRFAIWGHYGPASMTAGSFLFEIDGFGTTAWGSRFPTIGGSRPTIALSNGALFVNGRFGDDAAVLRANPAAGGALTGACAYGIPGRVEEFFQVLPNGLGGFAAVGSTQIVDAVPATASNVYLVKAAPWPFGFPFGDSCCYWAPIAPPRLSAPPPWYPKQLQYEDRSGSYYIRMTHQTDVTVQAQLCLCPGPMVYGGDPAGTTVGLPALDINSLPSIGNAGFGIDASLLVPNSLSLLAVSPVLAPAPMPLAFLGGQPGLMLHADPATLFTSVMFNSADGDASFPLPIPNDPQLVGLGLHWQVLDFDLALPFALPLGGSQVMTTIIE